jgi:hypothetical protein
MWKGKPQAEALCRPNWPMSFTGILHGVSEDAMLAGDSGRLVFITKAPSLMCYYKMKLIHWIDLSPVYPGRG